MLIVFMSLCFTPSIAQTNDSLAISISESPITLNLERAGAIDSLRTLFDRRTSERLKSLGDYVAFASKSSRDIRLRRHYANHILEMFHPEASAKVISGENTVCYSLKSFVNRLLDDSFQKHYIVEIDSICIPKWDSTLVANDSLGYIISPGEMVPVRRRVSFGGDNSELIIKKETTEDGDEWIPQFGNIVVSLRVRHKNEK